jgi:hypothetical protein
MKHVYQALCLMLLLIAGQHGAVVHELGHVAESRGAAAAANEKTDAICALCPSFAQVATAAFSHSFAVPLPLRVELGCIPANCSGRTDASVLTPRSRGPPSLS